jgi:hypothetical protein
VRVAVADTRGVQYTSRVSLPRAPVPVRLAIVSVLVVTAIVSFWRLGDAPIFAGVDEARFAVRAQSIATTGRDIDGARMPLYFHIINPLSPDDASTTWWQPLLFYFTAAVFRIVPLSEQSVRVPVASIAILNVWLIYLVARRVFASPWYAVLAASTLALTPAHFMFARQAQDYFLLLPVALGWLWCVIRCLETDGIWMPAATGVLLGLGMYCHISSWVVMPSFLVVTIGLLWAMGKRSRSIAPLIAGFGVPLLPLIPWVWFHPSLPAEMLENYKVVRGLRLIDRVDIYWDYFNPSYLFFSGGSNPMFATRRAGVLLLACAVLLPAGVWSLVRGRFSSARAAILFGFFFAPVAIVAALPEDPKYYTPRDLLVLPFAVLLVVAGAQWLFERRSRIVAVIAAALIVAMPVQFASFARYYFGEYQRWSASRFDELNLRDVAAYVIAADDAARIPAVYFSEDVKEPQAHQWLFYLLKSGRPDLLKRSRHFEFAQFDPSDAPSGSLLVADAHNPALAKLQASCSAVRIVADLGGAPAATIWRRN